MATRNLTIGVLALVLAAPLAARAEDDRPTGEPGGLFSLFMGAAGEATPTPAPEAQELGADERPAVAAPAEEPAAAEPAPPDELPPAVAEPKTEEAPPSAAATEPKTEEPAPSAAAVEPPSIPAEPPVPPADAPVAAEPAREEPPVAAAPAPEAPSLAAPPASAAPSGAEEPAWPARSDSGGTLAEQQTPGPEPKTTPAAGLAALEPPPAAAPETGEERGVEAPSREPDAKPELAAREVPLTGGSVSPGAVALPETEIQGEIEKPDIFFLLPKARDQSDDQVIRARIRREITQPLVKEWLEEMMLLK